MAFYGEAYGSIAYCGWIEAKAFSSEVDAGSRRENASNKDATPAAVQARKITVPATISATAANATIRQLRFGGA
jgi:hypothetical protein